MLFLGGVPRAAAQIDRTTLEGTVSDASGGVVEGAKVQITAAATGIQQEKVTNSYGVYRFPSIAIGFYRVRVSRDAFTTVEFEEVELRVGETRTLDVKLAVGSVSTQVEVKPAPALERSNADSSNVIQGDQIQNLPVNGRNWATLTLLAPWAQDDGGGDQRTIRFAGRARDDNNFTFDGVEATGIQEQSQKSQVRLQISEDAIAEYDVKSALYSAEYGAGDGGQINVVTKSGTNEFHGTVFGFFRNSVFDARAFIDPSPIPSFHLGQYGLTFGGPIQKDKTFFFLSYEGLRQRQDQTLIASVPDATLQQQVLATSPVLCPILQAFPWRSSTGTIHGCVPRFTSPDVQFSEQGGGIDNFTHAGVTEIHEDTWLVRMDHRFSDQTTLYGRAQRDIALTNAPLGNALDRQGIFNHPANYIIALEHSFSPTILNEVKFGINRSPFHNPQISVFPVAVSTSNFETLNNSNTDNEVGTTLSYIDNLTISHGRQTFKMGFELRHIRLNQGITADNGITFTDNNSLILNQMDNFLYRSSWCCHAYRRTLYLPYFQDEWKLTPTLTANLGIRWEYYGVAHEANNRTQVFDFGRCHGYCAPGSPLYFPSYRNFDPRVAIAWAPGALHANTVVRTGFGIYHGAGQNDDLNAGLESDNIRQGASGGGIAFTNGFLQNPPNFGLPTLLQPAPRALQRNRRDLYVEEWGLTVDQSLPKNFIFSVSYLGSHGVRLFSRSFINVCSSNIGGNCVRPLDAFPLPDGSTFGVVDIKYNDGQSHFNGLELALQRRITNGWSFQSKYTFSHSTNDGSVGGGEANASENIACLPCDKGPSVFDIRHNLFINLVYELPIGPGKAHWHASGFAGKLLEGWEVSGLGGWHTGHPLTVLFGPSSSFLPDGNDQSDQRPDIVPGVSVVPPGGGNSNQWINPAAFQAPPHLADGPLLRFGNAGRGLVRAPGVWQIDFSISKETKLTERLAMEFRVAAFNILNHLQLGDPSHLTLDYITTDSNGNPIPPFVQAPSNFGQIDSTVNFNNNNDNFAPDNVGTGLPRQLEFMIRFKF
jgi:hypothetical protein